MSCAGVGYDSPMTVTAGIVLAGGRSSRMGTPKAALEWHGSTLLRRVVGIVGRAVDRVVVVRAPGQALPALPEGVVVVEDAREGRGPLQGILAGMEAVGADTETVYVSGTDVPLLHPAFVARVLGATRDGADVAVPRAGGFRHPLAAAYCTRIAPELAALVAAERMKPAFLFERCRVAWLDEAALLADPRLAAADPALDSLRNLNAPADYDAARALPAPAVRVERYGILRADGPAAVTVRAATLGAAITAVGLELDAAGHLVAALNGDHVSRDPELPLAAGDTLALLAGGAGG